MSMKRNVKTIIVVAATCLSPTAAAVAGLSLLTLPGCFLLGSPGPSDVGQGRQYKSGDPTFDEFFESLYDLQVEMATAPDEEKEIRKRLAKQLEVDQDASASLLAKKAGEIAKEMATKGVGLKVEMDEGDVDAKPTAEVHTAGGMPNSDDKAFIDAVETTMQKELDLARAMKKRQKALERMEATIVELEPRIDTTFRLGGPRKKAEVRKNIDDAKKLFALMTTRADDVQESARQTAKKLAEAVKTDDGKFSAPPPPEEPEAPAPDEGSEKKAKPAKHPAQHAAPPPAAPAPKPKPAPPPSDFEP